MAEIAARGLGPLVGPVPRCQIHTMHKIPSTAWNYPIWIDTIRLQLQTIRRAHPDRCAAGALKPHRHATKAMLWSAIQEKQTVRTGWARLNTPRKAAAVSKYTSQFHSAVQLKTGARSTAVQPSAVLEPQTGPRAAAVPLAHPLSAIPQPHTGPRAAAVPLAPPLSAVLQPQTRPWEAAVPPSLVPQTQTGRRAAAGPLAPPLSAVLQPRTGLRSAVVQLSAVLQQRTGPRSAAVLLSAESENLIQPNSPFPQSEFSHTRNDRSDRKFIAIVPTESEPRISPKSQSALSCCKRCVTSRPPLIKFNPSLSLCQYCDPRPAPAGQVDPPRSQ